MTVSDVLRDRMREPAGFQAMAIVSVVAHLAVVGVFLFTPANWFARATAEPASTMVITLGGSGTGPQSGGFTALSARPVQTVEPAPKPEPLQAPAPKVPEMALPKPAAKPVKAPAPARAAEAADDARGRTPTRGSEVRAGNAVAETGARGQGFGLSTGGGAGSGSTLDVADFCCPGYIALMIDMIRSNWNQQVEVPGIVVVKFTIHRDGRLTDTTVERSSGYEALDLNARRAVEVTRQLTQLPAEFPNQSLTVHLNFQYQR